MTKDRKIIPYPFFNLLSGIGDVSVLRTWKQLLSLTIYTPLKNSSSFPLLFKSPNLFVINKGFKVIELVAEMSKKINASC